MDEQQAYDYCIQLLMRREYSRQELSIKLSQKKFAAEVVDNCLDRLVLENYQSDERFVEMFCRTKVSQRYGERKIRQELRYKGLCDESIIGNYLSQYKLLYLENATHLVRRKLSEEQLNESCCDRKTKDKIIRFLLGKGYDYQVINQAFEQVFNPKGND